MDGSLSLFPLEPSDLQNSAYKSGFDLTASLSAVCHDIASRMEELRHVDLSRVGISICQTRRRTAYGLYASLTPLRFENGNHVRLMRGRHYRVERFRDESGRELLYILSFYVPRFTDLSFREKLITIFHELWHISPLFNGDIRRFDGRCHAHTSSKRNFDAHMAILGEKWLALGAPRQVYGFLECNFDQLQQRYGHVYGARYRRPRLLPVSSEVARKIEAGSAEETLRRSKR